jgi:hypothetical protein
LHEKLENEVTELHSLDPRNYLFNGQGEGDYLFGQGIINEASSDDKEYLQLYEHGVCLPTESSTKICLQFWMKSVYVNLEKSQVSQTKFANSLICMMMKEYMRI